MKKVIESKIIVEVLYVSLYMFNNLKQLYLSIL